MFLNCVRVLLLIFLQLLPAYTKQVADSKSILPNTSICGHQVVDATTAEGNTAGIKDFPWTARIKYQKPTGTSFSCSGSLISDRYVLTSAHCIKQVPNGWIPISVRLGDYDISTETDCINQGDNNYCAPPHQDISIEEVIAHEGFSIRNRSQVNDIALIRLATTVTFSDFIQPICVPQTQLENRHEGEKMYIAGWNMGQGNRTSSNLKLKYNIPIISNNNCGDVYRTAGVTLYSTQICAGGEAGKDICRGNGGGPLMSTVKNADNTYNWFVRGIVSFGPAQCGKEGWPSVYTRVNDYVEWINSQVRT